MKTKLTMMLLALAMVAFAAQAQIKIGYTNSEYVLSLMPETKQVDAQLKEYQAQLSNQLKAKTDDFQKKLEYYQQNGSTMTDVIRADKEAELQALQSQIQKFEQNAQQSLQNKQLELFKPTLDKIQKTINDVAEANGYSHIFGSQSLLYAKEGNKDEFTNLVLAKLGITPPAN